MNEKSSLSPSESVGTGANGATPKPSLDLKMCVVCGGHVEPGRHGAPINHLGNTIHVCGPNYLRAFASDLAPYLGRLARAMRERAWKPATDAV